MMNGRGLALFFEGLIPAGLRCSAVLLSAAAAALTQEKEFFPALPLILRAVLIAVLLSGAVFLVLFSYLRQMYFNSRLYCLLEGEDPCPSSFFSIKRLRAYLYCRALVAVKKLLWAVFYFTPLWAVVFIIYFSFAANGQMLKSTHTALVSAAAVFFVTGLCFYFFSTGRYFFCDFLFSRNPLQPPAEIVRESVRLSHSRLADIFVKRLRLSVKNAAAFPFNRVFVKCLAVALAEQYFCDRKYYSALKSTLGIKNAGKRRI